MTYGAPIGSVHRLPCSIIAAAAADQISRYKRPRAVTIDPEGRVYVEAVKDAAEADIVGIYDLSLDVLALTQAIADDLMHEKQARFLKPKRRRSADNHARASA